MPQTVILRNFDFVSYTDKGLEREKNEDYAAYFDTLNGHVFVVCDGMGGHASGEVASEMAVEAVGEYFNSEYYKNPFLAVENAIIYANKKVFEHAKTKPEFHNMGTTIVLVLIRDNRIFYGHVGDSRLYIYKKNNIRQLTKDHSYVNKLIDEKRISKKEALTHPLRNEITKALGLFSVVEPEVSNSAFIPKEGDTLLLCSDGLNNMVSDRHIEKILSGKENIKEKAETLIQAALDNGGIDNITLQLIRFHNIDSRYVPREKRQLKLKRLLNAKFGIISVLVVAVLFSLFLFLKKLNKNKLLQDEKPVSVSSNYIPGSSKSVMIYPYRVEENETLELIAQKFNVDTSYLHLLNPNISNVYRGKHLKIPVQGIFVVQTYEDPETICLQYKITMEELMRANGFCSKSIPVGKKLIIPLSDE